MSLLGRRPRRPARQVPLHSRARGGGEQDVDLDLAGQLQGRAADAGARLRRLGRRRDPGGVRAGDPVLAAQDRRRPAEGGVAMAIPAQVQPPQPRRPQDLDGHDGLRHRPGRRGLPLRPGARPGRDADPLGHGLDAQRHRDARRAPRPRCRASSRATRPSRSRRCRAPSAAPPGKPYVSPELLTLINVPRADGKTFSNVQIRGMAPIGMEIRPGVKIVDGRMFNAGDQRGDRLEEPLEALREHEGRRHAEDRQLPVGHRRPLRRRRQRLRVRDLDGRDGPAAADQAQHLLVGLRAPAGRRAAAAASSRRSRATSA